MSKQYSVAGYVKLAKLWERNREEAVELHYAYFEERCRTEADTKLVDVYIDITGNKHLYKRKEMVRLLRDCQHGKIDLIWSQTRAYLAPNSEEMCFLMKYLFDMPFRIDILTDDNDRRMDTISNAENQRESLIKMAESYVNLETKEYESWCNNITKAMKELVD